MIRCYVTKSEAKEDARTTFNAYKLLVNSLRLNNQERVCMIESPEKADIIIFAETHSDDSEHIDAVKRVMRSPLYMTFKHKCAVHSGKDFPRTLLPGVYPSIPNRWARKVQCCGGPYLAPLNPYMDGDHGWDGEIKTLAGFLGCCERKRVRISLKKHAIDTGWNRIKVNDCTREFIGSLREGDLSQHLALKREFVRQILSSKFALCPRGTGPSSFRIFEAMQLGRAPVIISDDWTPPVGPDWPRFTIRVSERNIAKIPQVLAKHESAWEIMGQHAKKAWLKWYSPSAIGTTVVESAMISLNAWKKNLKRSHCRARIYCFGPRRFDLFLHKVVLRKLRHCKPESKQNS